MKVPSKKRKLHDSPSFRPNVHDYSANISFKKRKMHKIRRKRRPLGRPKESTPLVLLSNVHKRLENERKRLKSVRSGSSNWNVTPVENFQDESRSSSSDANNSSNDMDQSINSLNNISEIYKQHAEESLNSNLNDHDQSQALTSEDFDHMLEAAAEISDVDSNESDKKFYLEKKEEISSQKIPMVAESMENAKNVTLTRVPFKNCVIAVMDHPASITLYGYVSVEVLTGTVSVYGHELNPKDVPVRVFSAAKTGFIQVITEKFDHIWKQYPFLQLLSHLTKVTGSTKSAKNILRRFGNTTVAVVVTDAVLPTNLRFVELYFPVAFKRHFNKNYQKKLFGKTVFPSKKKMNCFSQPVDAVKFEADAEDLASDIISEIRNSKLKDSDGPRIVVYGVKRAGKSTLLRYLMNKALSMFPVVYYLDTDPGQTEFTPPGVISLTAVNKPVFGPPFAHQRKPVSMCFTGSVSPVASPDMYSKCVAKLALLYKQRFAKEPLFVNTMGWIQGIGQECLKNVVKAVDPTILVEKTINEQELMFDYRDFSSHKFQFYQLSIKRLALKTADAIRMREYALLSYFGKCQRQHERPNYLNSFKPFSVCWDKIPIYRFGSKIFPYRMVESLNATVVALCRVDESLVLESTNPNLPKTLEDEPENECFGYGIVRAIDEAKHLLYIVTPLSLDEIKHVNAILTGNVLVPQALFLEQPILGVHLPFTQMGYEEPGLSESASEGETEDNELVAGYRKKIPWAPQC